ncbi:MAG TPA: hypothetical protein VFR23_04510 [Jiangellaceae bacterium]|nr:hypothetical protein [Jiangellaceae bacterium]
MSESLVAPGEFVRIAPSLGADVRPGSRTIWLPPPRARSQGVQ